MVAYPSPSVLSYIQKGAYRCKGKTVPRGGPTDTETSFGLTPEDGSFGLQAEVLFLRAISSTDGGLEPTATTAGL